MNQCRFFKLNLFTPPDKPFPNVSWLKILCKLHWGWFFPLYNPEVNPMQAVMSMNSGRSEGPNPWHGVQITDKEVWKYFLNYQFSAALFITDFEHSFNEGQFFSCYKDSSLLNYNFHFFFFLEMPFKCTWKSSNIKIGNLTLCDSMLRLLMIIQTNK